MESDHVGIKINDQIAPNFQTNKGVRQGDPLSPILVKVVVHMLAIVIKRAKNDWKMSGVIPNIIDDGLLILILQYVDDMILFMDHM
jgi:hypothetical protein